MFKRFLQFGLQLALLGDGNKGEQVALVGGREIERSLKMQQR